MMGSECRSLLVAGTEQVILSHSIGCSKEDRVLKQNRRAHIYIRERWVGGGERRKKKVSFFVQSVGHVAEGPVALQRIELDRPKVADLTRKRTNHWIVADARRGSAADKVKRLECTLAAFTHLAALRTLIGENKGKTFYVKKKGGRVAPRILDGREKKKERTRPPSNPLPTCNSMIAPGHCAVGYDLCVGHTRGLFTRFPTPLLLVSFFFSRSLVPSFSTKRCRCLPLRGQTTRRDFGPTGGKQKRWPTSKKQEYNQKERHVCTLQSTMDADKTTPDSAYRPFAGCPCAAIVSFDRTDDDSCSGRHTGTAPRCTG